MFKQIRILRNYLVYQIFLSFMVMLAIILGVALVLPNFDARTFSPIEDSARNYFKLESSHTQNEYNLDEIFRRGLSVSSVNGYDVILLDRETSEIIGVTDKQQSLLQAFILEANNHNNPQQRLFGNLEFYGPFEVKSNTHSYYQYFIRQVSPQQEFLNHIFDSPKMMLLVLLFVSIPIVLWLSHRIAKPVKQLRFAANAVATGDLTEYPQLEKEGSIEFRQVGSSFNQMIHALQRLRSYQQRLISDISHELKTPLTRMQLALSLLRRRNGESSEVLRIEKEIEKLDQMIQDLLALSRRNLDHHLQREIFSINQIWEDILADAVFEFEASGFKLIISNQIKNPDIYKINGNVSILASAVENVLRNAKKYANNKVKITTYIESNQNLSIIIDDDGEGVPEDQYQEIFRPFYRVGDDRARQTGGTGLGLAIVANAVEHHHGIVYAEKSPLGGLRVKIQLPLWKE